MNNVVFLVLFFSLGILYFYIGIRAGKKNRSDLDYFVAGRSLGTLQISCNLIATQLGGGLLLGTASAAYTSGVKGLSYCLGIVLGFLLLGSGVAQRLQEFKVVTTAQLFEVGYDSKLLKCVASILSILTLFGILIAQAVGMKSLVMSVGFSQWSAVILWMMVTLYTSVGGMRAISINDIIQLGIITVTFFGVFIYSVFQDPSSLTQVMNPSQFSNQVDMSSVLSVILVPALFCLIEQDMAQRFFASRTKAVARRSALIAGTFMLIFGFIPVYLGMMTRIKGLPVGSDQNALLIFLKDSVPVGVFMVAICAIFAAIISTADALINGISANITQDFEGNKVSPKFTSLASGTAALIASYYVPQNMIDILISSYELSVSCLLVSLVQLYLRRPLNRNAALVSVAVGFISFVILQIFSLGVFRVLISLGMSLCGFVVAQWKTKKYIS